MGRKYRRRRSKTHFPTKRHRKEEKHLTTLNEGRGARGSHGDQLQHVRLLGRMQTTALEILQTNKKSNREMGESLNRHCTNIKEP